MSKEFANDRTTLAIKPSRRRWQFDLRTLLWWMTLAALLLGFIMTVPPTSPFSGPLFLLAKFDLAIDRGIAYAWAALILLVIAAYPAWPRRWTFFATVGGVVAWGISSLFVRFSIDW